MNDELSKAEIGKDAAQHVAEAAASTIGQVATIMSTAVKDVAGVLGEFATEVLAIGDSVRGATADTVPDSVPETDTGTDADGGD